MATTRMARNPRTGETREVTDEDLQSQMLHLRNEGFVMDDSAASAGEPEDYESLTVDELKARATDAGVDVKRGDGEEGSPLKADYIKALKRHDKRAASQNA